MMELFCVGSPSHCLPPTGPAGILGRAEGSQLARFLNERVC